MCLYFHVSLHLRNLFVVSVRRVDVCSINSFLRSFDAKCKALRGSHRMAHFLRKKNVVLLLQVCLDFASSNMILASPGDHLVLLLLGAYRRFSEDGLAALASYTQPRTAINTIKSARYPRTSRIRSMELWVVLVLHTRSYVVIRGHRMRCATLLDVNSRVWQPILCSR